MATRQKIEEILGLMLKNLECSICLEPLKNSVSTKCDHHFCKFCITEFLETKRSVPCPLCKQPITKRSLQDRAELDNIVSSVQKLVTCYQEDTGILFSPPKVPQSFFPCTPEQILPNVKVNAKKNLRSTTRRSRSSVEESFTFPAERACEASEGKIFSRLSKDRLSDPVGKSSCGIENCVSSKSNDHNCASDSRRRTRSATVTSELRNADLIKVLEEGSCGYHASDNTHIIDTTDSLAEHNSKSPRIVKSSQGFGNIHNKNKLENCAKSLVHKGSSVKNALNMDCFKSKPFVDLEQIDKENVTQPLAKYLTRKGRSAKRSELIDAINYTSINKGDTFTSNVAQRKFKKVNEGKEVNRKLHITNDILTNNNHNSYNSGHIQEHDVKEEKEKTTEEESQISSDQSMSSTQQFLQPRPAVTRTYSGYKRTKARSEIKVKDWIAHLPPDIEPGTEEEDNIFADKFGNGRDIEVKSPRIGAAMNRDKWPALPIDRKEFESLGADKEHNATEDLENDFGFKSTKSDTVNDSNTSVEELDDPLKNALKEIQIINGQQLIGHSEVQDAPLKPDDLFVMTEKMQRPGNETVNGNEFENSLTVLPFSSRKRSIFKSSLPHSVQNISPPAATNQGSHELGDPYYFAVGNTPVSKAKKGRAKSSKKAKVVKLPLSVNIKEKQAKYILVDKSVNQTVNKITDSTVLQNEDINSEADPGRSPEIYASSLPGKSENYCSETEGVSQFSDMEPSNKSLTVDANKLISCLHTMHQFRSRAKQPKRTVVKTKDSRDDLTNQEEQTEKLAAWIDQAENHELLFCTQDAHASMESLKNCNENISENDISFVDLHNETGTNFQNLLTQESSAAKFQKSAEKMENCTSLLFSSETLSSERKMTTNLEADAVNLTSKNLNIELLQAKNTHAIPVSLKQVKEIIPSSLLASKDTLPSDQVVIPETQATVREFPNSIVFPSPLVAAFPLKFNTSDVQCARRISSVVSNHMYNIPKQDKTMETDCMVAENTTEKAHCTDNCNIISQKSIEKTRTDNCNIISQNNIEKTHCTDNCNIISQNSIDKTHCTDNCNIISQNSTDKSVDESLSTFVLNLPVDPSPHLGIILCTPVGFVKSVASGEIEPNSFVTQGSSVPEKPVHISSVPYAVTKRSVSKLQSPQGEKLCKENSIFDKLPVKSESNQKSITSAESLQEVSLESIWRHGAQSSPQRELSDNDDTGSCPPAGDDVWSKLPHKQDHRDSVDTCSDSDSVEVYSSESDSENMDILRAGIRFEAENKNKNRTISVSVTDVADSNAEIYSSETEDLNISLVDAEFEPADMSLQSENIQRQLFPLTISHEANTLCNSCAEQPALGCERLKSGYSESLKYDFLSKRDQKHMIKQVESHAIIHTVDVKARTKPTHITEDSSNFSTVKPLNYKIIDSDSSITAIPESVCTQLTCTEENHGPMPSSSAAFSSPLGTSSAISHLFDSDSTVEPSLSSVPSKSSDIKNRPTQGLGKAHYVAGKLLSPCLNVEDNSEKFSSASETQSQSFLQTLMQSEQMKLHTEKTFDQMKAHTIYTPCIVNGENKEVLENENHNQNVTTPLTTNEYKSQETAKNEYVLSEKKKLAESDSFKHSLDLILSTHNISETLKEKQTPAKVLAAESQSSEYFEQFLHAKDMNKMEENTVEETQDLMGEEKQNSTECRKWTMAEDQQTPKRIKCTSECTSDSDVKFISETNVLEVKSDCLISSYSLANSTAVSLNEVCGQFTPREKSTKEDTPPDSKKRKLIIDMQALPCQKSEIKDHPLLGQIDMSLTSPGNISDKVVSSAPPLCTIDTASDSEDEDALLFVRRPKRKCFSLDGSPLRTDTPIRRTKPSLRRTKPSLKRRELSNIFNFEHSAGNDKMPTGAKTQRITSNKDDEEDNCTSERNSHIKEAVTVVDGSNREDQDESKISLKDNLEPCISHTTQAFFMMPQSDSKSQPVISEENSDQTNTNKNTVILNLCSSVQRSSRKTRRGLASGQNAEAVRVAMAGVEILVAEKVKQIISKSFPLQQINSIPAHQKQIISKPTPLKSHRGENSCSPVSSQESEFTVTQDVLSSQKILVNSQHAFEDHVAISKTITTPSGKCAPHSSKMVEIISSADIKMDVEEIECSTSQNDLKSKTHFTEIGMEVKKPVCTESAETNNPPQRTPTQFLCRLSNASDFPQSKISPQSKSSPHPKGSQQSKGSPQSKTSPQSKSSPHPKGSQQSKTSPQSKSSPHPKVSQHSKGSPQSESSHPKGSQQSESSPHPKGSPQSKSSLHPKGSQQSEGSLQSENSHPKGSQQSKGSPQSESSHPKGSQQSKGSPQSESSPHPKGSQQSKDSPQSESSPHPKGQGSQQSKGSPQSNRSEQFYISQQTVPCRQTSRTDEGSATLPPIIFDLDFIDSEDRNTVGVKDGTHDEQPKQTVCSTSPLLQSQEEISLSLVCKDDSMVVKEAAHADGEDLDEDIIIKKKKHKQPVISDSESTSTQGSDIDKSSYPLNFTSSSTVSSQSEALTTQQRHSMELELERLRIEIAEMEAKLHGQGKSLVNREGQGKSEDSYDLQSRSFGKGPIQEEYEPKDVQLFPSAEIQRNYDKDHSSLSNSDNDSDDLFLSPLSPSPPPPVKQSLARRQLSSHLHSLFAADLEEARTVTSLAKVKQRLDFAVSGRQSTDSTAAVDIHDYTADFSKYDDIVDSQSSITTFSAIASKIPESQCASTSSSCKQKPPDSQQQEPSSQKSPGEEGNTMHEVCNSNSTGILEPIDEKTRVFSCRKKKRVVTCGMHDEEKWNEQKVFNSARNSLAHGSENIDEIPRWQKQRMGFVASGLDEEKKLLLQRFAEGNECKLYSKFNNQVTHVIMKTHPDTRICDRTLKYFQGISGQCWVLKFSWVEDSFEAGFLLPEEDYEIQGDTVKGENHDGPKLSRLSNRPLLAGFAFACIGVSPDMSKKELAQLLTLNGAEVADDPWGLATHTAKYKLVLRCVDSDSQPPTPAEIELFNGHYKHFGLVTVAREWILDSISTYHIQPLADYVFNTCLDLQLPF